MTESWRSAFANRSLATSFESQAAQYAMLRPGYPTEAVDVALPADAARVLDLGAGTGKLTGSLLGRGIDVIAVEPLGAMLAELHRSLPTAMAVSGSAESIPLRANAVDAVLVGQAFHWFDPARALPEMARVLRPGGRLSLLWNHDDVTDPLVQEIESALNRAGRPAGGSTGRSPAADRPAASDESADSVVDESAGVPFHDDPSFTEPELTEIPWTREQRVEDFIGLQRTYSYVIRASDRVRAHLDSEVRAVLRRHQPGGQVRIPVICQVWRSRCL